MYLDTPPTVIDAEVRFRLPSRFRRGGEPSNWVERHKPGQRVDSFLEGPVFDTQGNLMVVDVPYGRMFRVDPQGEWTQLTEYDGHPNGCRIHPDGRILVADQLRGLLHLDPSGEMHPVLGPDELPGFRGFNDLAIATNGDVYVTDQGLTGLHDPTGRVLRLGGGVRGGRVDVLMDNVPSPNGIVLDSEERVVFVAVTRDNSVWRAPLHTEPPWVSKVGRFVSLFGTSGPDGLALLPDGRLVVAHASLGSVFVFRPNGELALRVRSSAGDTCTNVALGGPGRTELFVTESSTGSILAAPMPPG